MSAGASLPTIGWVAPSFDGPATGGTRYNAELSRALAELGCAVLRLAPADVPGARVDVLVVDSLHLPEVPELARRRPAGARVLLLLHYLPSWVAAGRMSRTIEPAEQAALAAVDAVVATSALSGRVASELASRVLVVEPGVEQSPPPTPAASTGAGLSALVVANVTEGKGILALVEGLGRRARVDDALELSVVGSLAREPRYADACVAAAASLPPGIRVRFEGPLPPWAMGARLGRAQVLVSASRMESYGMALSEARAVGLPILALDRGNVPALVVPEAGGERVPDDSALVESLLELSRSSAMLAERTRAARAHTLVRRWADAARELLAQLSAAS